MRATVPPCGVCRDLEPRRNQPAADPGCNRQVDVRPLRVLADRAPSAFRGSPGHPRKPSCAPSLLCIPQNCDAIKARWRAKASGMWLCIPQNCDAVKAGWRGKPRVCRTGCGGHTIIADDDNTAKILI